MSGSRRKYLEGSAKVNVTMPTPLAERVAKMAHERSKATGRLISRSDVINEIVREALAA